MMCLHIGTPNNYRFPFGTNGKIVVIGVPILKHFRGKQKKKLACLELGQTTDITTETTQKFT